MSKKDIIGAIQDACLNSNNLKRGMTKVLASEVADAVFKRLGTELQQTGRFSYPGFGSLTVRFVYIYFLHPFSMVSHSHFLPRPPINTLHTHTHTLFIFRRRNARKVRASLTDASQFKTKPAHNIVKFKPSASLVESVSETKPFAREVKESSLS